MGVDLGNTIHFFIPFLLCLVGFHGVFFYSTAWRKTAAWCAFQAGLVVLLFQLASDQNVFPLALAWLTLAVTGALALLLGIFSLKLGGKTKPSRRTPHE